MSRPGLRPMRALPLLEPRRTALEKCVFCPKLCRSACPVSNAEPRETLTPWGKMSAAWMSAHGDVAFDDAHAAPAWACTDCGACTMACDHRNPVADVLLDARDAFARAGLAPAAAARAASRFGSHRARTKAAARRVAPDAGSSDAGGNALFAGCVYLRAAPDEARQAVRVLEALTGRPAALIDDCCGLPLRLAGDRRGFGAHAARIAESLQRRERVFALDPGCALTLRRRYPAEAGVEVRPPVALLVEEVAAAPAVAAAPPAIDRGPVRWHDPCQLGRGLGVYEAPRRVLERVLGRAPEELADRREAAHCSGAGGLLPRTMPDVARAIAAARLDEHAAAGGGTLVTGCGSSLVALRRRARRTGVRVDDLVSWMARGLGVKRAG